MNNRLISGIGTAAFVAIVVAILLAFGYNPPDLPIPEEGVEVNVGDSDFGLGTSPQTSTMPNNYASPAAQERVATQNVESTPSFPATPSTGKTNPNATPQTQEENKQPELNPNARFPGMRNRNKASGSEGQGISTGANDQGKADGSANSNNYSGNGQGAGVSYSLAGRSPVSLPQPAYKSNKQGKVVIRVWVDRQGKVTRAEYEPKGSTISDGNLVSPAIAAAKKARFNADAGATEEQKGTITYIFKL